jgi:hypothetical protein
MPRLSARLPSQGAVVGPVRPLSPVRARIGYVLTWLSFRYSVLQGVRKSPQNSPEGGHFGVFSAR